MRAQPHPQSSCAIRIVLDPPRIVADVRVAPRAAVRGDGGIFITRRFGGRDQRRAFLRA
jgi:hypothetical protein